jgi:hypothetical protein
MSMPSPELVRTSDTQVVGRTTPDLIYEVGLPSALAKLIAELDGIEILGTTAYVLLMTLGKQGPVMSFWLFLILLAGYHIALRPIASFVSWKFERIKGHRSN